MLTLGLAAWPAAAAPDVNRTGDTSPPFTPGPIVDLTGQRVFLGFTNGAVGTQGTLSVTGGGVLTAAQIVPGVGGLLGTGFVTVDGAGSVINLTGGAAFNGLDIGSWGTGVVTVSNGGAIVCASTLTCAGNTIGNAAGSTGTLAINGGSVTGLGTLTVGLGQLQASFGTPGANTSATLTITNAGTLSSTGFNSVASNSSQTGQVTGSVTIDGAGSSWSITRDLANGGGQAFLNVGNAANTNGNVTISNGGNLTITGSRATPATDNSLPGIQLAAAAGATASMTVTTGGSVRIGGDTGILIVGGSSSAGSAGASATLNITGGGTVSGNGPNGLSYMAIGRNLATGVVNVSGAGSQLVVAGVGGVNTQGLDGFGGLLDVGLNRGAGGGSGTLNVTNGGSVVVSDNGLASDSVGFRVARGTGSSGTVSVDGAGSSIVVSSTGPIATNPYVNIGDGGVGQMTISNGGSVSVLGSGQRSFNVGNSSTGSGTLIVTTGGSINASRFAVGDNGGSGVATIDQSTVNLDGPIFNNGLDGTPSGAGVRVGRGVGANGVLNLQNGAAININNSIAGASVVLGGTSVLAGGTGTLNMSGGSSINFTGSASGASLTVGGPSGTGFMTMTGNSVVNMGATGGVTVGSSVGSAGTLTVSGASAINANTFHVGGSSDTVAGGNGSAVVTGAGSALNISGADGFIGVGRGGTGSLTVSDQATVSATIVNVGRATGGVGTLTVDNAALNLSGQQTTGAFSGAALTIGNRGGTGTASITNGSVVTITNMGSSGASLNVGGTPTNPLGTGTLTVTDSQISVIAAPGQATVRIGHDGTGTATLTNSTLQVGSPTVLHDGPLTLTGGDGSLIIAGQPGSTGTLTLNAGSVVNAGYVGIGASPAGPGGAGHLILNNSTINTTTFEIGALGVLSGNGGTINASGNVIVAGTIDPGNSPGRVTINCNFITLAGSKLILDILDIGSGFDVDHLIFGTSASFDLSNLQVVFNFLGDTDPFAFAASGGFDLDNFLESQNLATGVISGLSTVFAPGQTWTDIIDPTHISVVSSVGGAGGLVLQADGTFTGLTAPVPEPSTWALMVVGLVALSVMARRRRR